MADRNVADSGMTGHETAPAPIHSTANSSGEPARNVVAEFIDAARSAAESLLEEQKHQLAERVSGIAEALRSAAHCLDQSQNRIIARYVDEARDQVESLSRTVRERRWNEIVSDTEDFARRQPTWFVLGAVATGFLVGRFLWASTNGWSYRSDADRESSTGGTATRAVTAAVSSGSGAGRGELAGHAAGSSGAMESR